MDPDREKARPIGRRSADVLEAGRRAIETPTEAAAVTPSEQVGEGGTDESSALSLVALMQRLVDEKSKVEGHKSGIASRGNEDSPDEEEELAFLRRLLPEKNKAGNTESEHGPGRLSADAFPLRIGRFELVSLLGHGGFGIVFRALDSKLGRQVALKILRPEVALSPSVARRFLREAKSAAQLEHPGIVSVYDVGRFAGLSYLAAPLCDGPDLAAWLKEHPGDLSPAQIAFLIAQVADAVHHAHQRGILHRDLKPSNILLKPTAGEARLLPFDPLLADFGLAGRLDQSDDETCYTTVLGTIHYMSPEQAAGRWKDVGAASDVFSLGVILYELLTGQRPFGGDHSDDIREAILGQSPAPLSRIRPSIPSDLQTICLKCLAKVAADRYLSAGELAADLRRFLDHQPIFAHPPGPVKQASLWCRRRPVIAALLLLLTVTLVTSAGVTGMLYRHEQLEHARAEEHLDFARQAVSKMYTKVADQWLVDQPEVQDLRREFLEDALRFYERIVAQRPHDEKSQHDLSVALHRMANITATLGRHDQTVQLRWRCLDIIDELRRDRHKNVAYDYDAFMYRLLLAGEMDTRDPKKIIVYREAEEIIRGLVKAAPSNPIYRDALAALCCDLASVLREAGDSYAAEKYWIESAAVSEALVDEFPDRPMYAKHAATAYAALALRRREDGTLEEAKLLIAKAKQLIDDVRRKAPEARWADHWAYDVQIKYGCACADAGDGQCAVPLLEDCRDALTRLIEWYPKTPGYRADRARANARLASAYAVFDRKTDMLDALKQGESDALIVLSQIPSEATAKKALQAIVDQKNAMLIGTDAVQP